MRYELAVKEDDGTLVAFYTRENEEQICIIAETLAKSHNFDSSNFTLTVTTGVPITITKEVTAEVGRWTTG